MEMGIKMSENGIEEAKRADHPEIRLFLLSKTSSALPTDRLDGRWKVCTPQNLVEGGWEGFSAVGYYFSVKLREELDVPVGFIQSAFGGAWIHPFIRPDLLAEYESMKEFHQEWIDANTQHEKNPEHNHHFVLCTEYNMHKAGSTHNAMVHPFRHFSVKSLLWYQGESNVGDGMAYTEKLEALVRIFRCTFDNPMLSFFIAQIAPWGGYENPDALPRLWAAQYEAAATIEASGIVISIDAGMIGDIHPIYKKKIGERFANLALFEAYGKKTVPWMFPSPCEARKTPGRIVLLFNEGISLKSRDNKPFRWFELQAKYVLYAWNGLVEDVNLYTEEDLPVRPFRIRIS